LNDVLGEPDQELMPHKTLVRQRIYEGQSGSRGWRKDESVRAAFMGRLFLQQRNGSVVSINAYSTPVEGISIASG
jgi:hypothetical protein